MPFPPIQRATAEARPDTPPPCTPNIDMRLLAPSSQASPTGSAAQPRCNRNIDELGVVGTLMLSHIPLLPVQVCESSFGVVRCEGG